MLIKKDKYNVDKSKEKQAKRTYKGIVYASDLELRYFREIVEPGINSGDILSCKTQVKYEILPPFVHNNKKYNGINYVSDFNLIMKNGHEIVVDTKGFMKPMDVIKEKLLLSRYPEIDFRLIGFSKVDGGWVSIDTIKKGRSERKKLKESKKKSEETKCQK